MLRHYCNLVSIVLISLKSMRAENFSGDDRRGSGSRLGIFAEQKKDSKKDFLMFFNITTFLCTGCPKKHGNSVTNLISSLLWISIVIPNFKSPNIIMSARVYFMKRVKDCKDVPIMSPQDEQWRRTSLLCLYTVIFLFY